MNCDCDNVAPEFHFLTTPKARKIHKCNECGCNIKIGEIYEKVNGKWEGIINTMKTCPDCIAIREKLAEMPCYCLTYTMVLDDMYDFLNEMDGARKVSMLRLIAKHRKRKI